MLCCDWTAWAEFLFTMCPVQEVGQFSSKAISRSILRNSSKLDAVGDLPVGFAGGTRSIPDKGYLSEALGSGKITVEVPFLVN
jgi:hypothetical protein